MTAGGVARAQSPITVVSNGSTKKGPNTGAAVAP
jgi:hypothetical protein